MIKKIWQIQIKDCSKQDILQLGIDKALSELANKLQLEEIFK